MVLQAISGDRIDITVRDGAINRIIVELYKLDADGVRVAWDETTKPTVLAEIRADFATASPVLLSFAATVQTPTADSVDTLTVIFDLDLDAETLPPLATPANNTPFAASGFWDFRLALSTGEIFYPVWGSITQRRRITRPAP